MLREDLSRNFGFLLTQPVPQMINDGRAAIDEGIDLVAQHGNQKYIVQIKASSEARRDRAVPLLFGLIAVSLAASSFTCSLPKTC